MEGPQVSELIKEGYLVGTKVFAPSKPDLRGVRTRHGDYVESELAAVMDKAELVGDIVSHYLRHADGRKTVGFATNVAHSRHLRDEFVRAGVKAEHIDGTTPKEERDEILAKLAVGDLQLVMNCQVLTEGSDMPDVECCILARPTKSMGLFRQMVGRVLRPAEGKDHALILDHAGAVYQHGFIEDPVEWTLDVDKKARNKANESRNLQPSSRLLECSQCNAIRTAGKPCPHCGFMPKRPGEYHHVRDGELAHLDRDGTLKPQIYTPAERLEFFRGLLAIAIDRGKNPKSAAHRYREKFGSFPPWGWNDLGPAQPTPEVLAWDRHCRIRYAKSMEKAKAAYA